MLLRVFRILTILQTSDSAGRGAFLLLPGISCWNEVFTRQFFDVEYYLLNSKKYCTLKDKFVCVILKLMCYCHILVLWNRWIDKPKPELIENAVTEIMVNHSGTLNCLFPDENMLLVFDWDCLNLSVYNPPEKARRLLEKIAFSEGLFWRKSET